MVKVNARVYSSPTKITRVITVVSSALYFVTLVMQLSKKHYTRHVVIIIYRTIQSTSKEMITYYYTLLNFIEDISKIEAICSSHYDI